MANIPSVAKRARQSVRRHVRNSSALATLKTAKRRVREAVSSGDADAAKAAYSKLSSVLDKAVKRGVIHANAAKRGKSRLHKAVAGSGKSSPPAKSTPSAAAGA